MKNNSLILSNNDWHEQANKFANNYKIEKVLWGKNKEILYQSKLNCRFCKRSNPHVTFKQETHIIPQQWHKSKPISKFECDQCNELFSKFESDFGHYFIIDKSLFGHKKKKTGHTKLKTEGGSEISRLSDIEKINHLINLNPEQENAIQDDKSRIINVFTSFIDEKNEIINNDNGTFTFNLKRPPYRPINVLRTFIKIATSLIDETELEDYSQLIDFLVGKVDNLEFDKKLYVTQIPVLENFYPEVMAFLYKRISDEAIYKKTMVMFFGNKAYQIVIPSNNDLKLYPMVKTIRESPYKNPHILSKKGIDNENFVRNLEKAVFYDDDLNRLELERESTFTETLEVELLNG